MNRQITTALGGVRRGLYWAIGVTALLIAAASSAKMPPHAKEITTHLQFLGYRVTKSNGDLLAEKSSDFTFVVRNLSGGTGILTWFSTTPAANARRTEFLRIVNALNSKSTETTFWVDDKGELAASTWFAGSYERVRFGLVLDRFRTDVTEAIRTHSSELQPFLK